MTIGDSAPNGKQEPASTTQPQSLASIALLAPRIRDKHGIVHRYWADCDMWHDESVECEGPLTCIACIAEGA